MTQAAGVPAHHEHLEQARAQILDLLSRQAVERDLITRSEQRKQDVVAALVLRQQQAALEQRLAHFHPADVAFVLESLEPATRLRAWELVRTDRRAAVLLESSEAVRRELGHDQPLGAAEAPPDLSFPAGSVGARMTHDYITVREDATLEAVQRLLRRRKPLPKHTTQLFVASRNHTLLGLLAVQKLITEEPETLVEQVMLPEPVFFHTDDPIDKAVRAFEEHTLIAAPVVNLHRQIVGRLTVDSVVESINERVQAQRLEEVGLSADTDLEAPLKVAARARWQWLGVNLFTAFVASRVIGAFEGTIAQLVALATLMPIVASIGGNSGNQTVALVIRGLALNQLGPPQLRVMLAKELGIAAYNGAIWGGLLGLVTLLIYRSPPLSLVIALAMLLNLLVAASVGMLAPVVLHRLGRDPIGGSNVILTACTDSAGFFIFLGLAAAFLV